MSDHGQLTVSFLTRVCCSQDGSFTLNRRSYLVHLVEIILFNWRILFNYIQRSRMDYRLWISWI